MEDIRQLSQIDSDMSSGDGLEWQTYESDAWSSEESQRLHSYHCPSCGSEVMAEDSVAALNCVYCGNPLVLSDEFTGMAKPDGIVPFALMKEQAMEKLGGYLKGKMLLPSAFKTGNRIEEINGVYVPFWLFNCATDSDVTYKATRTRTRRRGDYMYTDTMHYRLRRGGNLSFADVPADASLKMDDTLMESIEPFKPSEGKEFTLPYLAGYSAQKADVGIDKCKPRVNARIKNSVEAALRGTISGYATVTQQNSAVRIQHGMVKQVMMPVWMLNTRFKEKDYTFAMNGQTGHFVGDLPCSFLKGAAWFLGIAGIPSLVSWLLMRNSGNSRFLPLVIILSLIAALVTVLVMRGKMKTVKKKKEASNYTVPGSFCLTRSQDIYLYTTTTRTRVANSSQRPGQRPGAHR
ncbi:MAG: hypothetical protein CW338_02240 [Clostridiales bacterium]|nr:hypothetical protein [Clostridiales bacterium]